MVHCAQPVRFGKRNALIVRDRSERRLRKFADEIRQSRQVQAAMDRREERHAEPGQQRQPIRVGVYDIKVSRLPGYGFEERGLSGSGI